jgi:hypothetical protein
MAGKNGDIPPRESADDEDDELARRLRDLEWPKPAPGVRDRALEEFERRLAEDGVDVPPASVPQDE